jgi:hypothetical protein
MAEKWLFNHIHGEDESYDIKVEWNNEILKATLKQGMTTPIFYDYSLLNKNNEDFAPRKINLCKKHFLKRVLDKIRF